MRDLSKHRYFYLALLVVVGLMVLMLHNLRRGADELNYLRWTHSLLFDQDLHLLNNSDAVGGSYRLTPTGYVFERVNIGAPLLWLPFYGAASLFMPASTDQLQAGDEPIQFLWINFSSWFYLTLAGILTVAALRRLYPAWVIAVTIPAIFLGTPVFFYLALYPMTVHPVSIFLAALLLYLWLPVASESIQPGASLYFVLGLVSGWLMLVASYNIVFFLLPGFSLFKEFFEQRAWPLFWLKSLALGLGGLVGFLPQMIVWWFLFGSPFYSPYSGQLLWSEPYLLETLFSTFHGLFFYAPVLLLVIPGLWWLGRANGWAALGLGLTWLGMTYVVSVNVAWWAGASFGNRYFLSLSPFFVWGLSAFIQRYPRWGSFLAALGVLWTVGLCLQFLSGVGVISDSVVYPASTLAAGQLTAWANIGAALPQLWANLPWLTVSGQMLFIFIVILAGISRWLHGWAGFNSGRPAGSVVQRVMAVGGGLVVLFVLIAGWRGDQTRAVLASQGFYDQPQEMVMREVKEVAGRAGLVTRAMYHEAVGQPDKATDDLQRASGLWKADTAAFPTRLYLGPGSSVLTDIPVRLHLDYPGGMRLLGYQILEANTNLVRGELFWEKQAGEESLEVATPIVRAFDRFGQNLGNSKLDSPFPAEYIPAGGLFRDSFTLQLAIPADSWLWLAVSMAETPEALPLNARGEAESGVIGSVNVEAVSLSPVVSAETSQLFFGKPELLLGADSRPGQTVPIQLVGQAAGSETAKPYLNLSVLDAAGKVAAQQQVALPGEESSGGNTTLCLALPTMLGAGNYQLALALQPPGAGPLLEAEPLPFRLLVTQSEPVPSICDLLQANFARRYEAPAPQHPLEATFAADLKLLGYDLAIIPQAGSATARVVLQWRALTPIRRNYLMSLQLLDGANQPLVTHTGTPVNGARPTSTWLQQELILDDHTLAVPPLEPGEYRLLLSVLDEQTNLPIENNLEQSSLILQQLQIP